MNIPINDQNNEFDQEFSVATSPHTMNRRIDEHIDRYNLTICRNKSTKEINRDIERDTNRKNRQSASTAAAAAAAAEVPAGRDRALSTGQQATKKRYRLTGRVLDFTTRIRYQHPTSEPVISAKQSYMFFYIYKYIYLYLYL